MNLFNILLMLVFLAFLTLAYQRNHMMMTLLSLEFIVLTLVMVALSYLGKSFSMHTFFMAIILTFGAIEASLGLAILISLTRKYGSDMVSNINMSKC